MVGANMFVIYQAQDGKNVTVSSRYGTDRTMPLWDSRAKLSLLEGSGVADGYMTANLRCSDCDRWASGYMNFTEQQADWVYAMKKGDAIKSNDVEYRITKHDHAEPFDWPITHAKGGDSLNPFVGQQKDVALVHSGLVEGIVEGTPPDSNGYTGAPPFVSNNLPNIHGGMGSIAFVVLFPIGGILIRLANFRGGIWVHVGVQIIAYVLAVGTVASGIRLATTLDKFVNAHPIIGIFLAALVIGQPIYGFIHHRQFKKIGHRTKISYVHLWFGRVIVFGGMINGGLGLVLAGVTDSKHVITYAVVAAILGISYILAIFWGERRRKRTKMGPTGFRKMDDQVSLVGQTREVGGDEDGLAQPHEAQEMRPLWLSSADKRESTEYTPLAAGEGYGDLGSRSRQPSPSGRYDDHDHHRASSMDSRARVSMT